MKKEAMKVLSVKLHDPIWDAMEDVYRRTGVSRADQVRTALMRYFSITDLTKPYDPAKQVAVAEIV